MQVSINNILRIYSLIFPILAFLLVFLNIKFGESYGDVSCRPLGGFSPIINILILLWYTSLITLNLILFTLSTCKKYFYFNLNMNIIASLVFAYLPYSLLLIAFGFIIVGPLLLLFISLWLGSWIKVLKFSSEESNNNEKFGICGFIAPLILFAALCGTTIYSFYFFL